MDYRNFKVFNAVADNGVLTVTIDFSPVNVQGQAMLEKMAMNHLISADLRDE